MGAIQCLERSEREAPPLGPNASQERKSSNNQAIEQELSARQSRVTGNPSIVEVGRDPQRPQVTSLPEAKSQQETQNLVKWSCHCLWGWESPASRQAPLVRQSRSTQRTRRMLATMALLNQSRGTSCLEA